MLLLNALHFAFSKNPSQISHRIKCLAKVQHTAPSNFGYHQKASPVPEKANSSSPDMAGSNPVSALLLIIITIFGTCTRFRPIWPWSFRLEWTADHPARSSSRWRVHDCRLWGRPADQHLPHHSRYAPPPPNYINLLHLYHTEPYMRLFIATSLAIFMHSIWNTSTSNAEISRAWGL